MRMPAARTRVRAVVAAVVVLVLAAAAVGAALSLRLVDPSGAPDRSGGDAATSFGVVSADLIRSVDGVSNAALSGASHGISGLVDDKHASIQVAVGVTNRLDHPIDHRTDRFRLLVTSGGTTTALEPTGGNVSDARVLPHTGVEGHLDFTVPRTPAHLALQFRDPGAGDSGGRDPVVIHLGQVDFPGTHSDPEPAVGHHHPAGSHG
jgi:hypothetical protein